MNVVYGLIGIIGALLAAFFFQRSKAQTSEALLENQKTKEELLNKDKDILQHNAELTLEEKTRKQLEEQTKEKQNEIPTPQNIIDFFSKRK